LTITLLKLHLLDVNTNKYYPDIISESSRDQENNQLLFGSLTSCTTPAVSSRQYALSHQQKKSKWRVLMNSFVSQDLQF